MTESEFRRYEGRTISRIRRAHYEHEGQIGPAAGLLEITFSDGDSVVFDCASDGQSLRVEVGPWLDPFDGPQSPENEEFIATSGKWSAVDVSAEEPFNRFIGQVVLRVRPTHYVHAAVSGIFIETAEAALVGENRFDEFYVTVVDLGTPPAPSQGQTRERRSG